MFQFSYAVSALYFKYDEKDNRKQNKTDYKGQYQTGKIKTDPL